MDRVEVGWHRPVQSRVSCKGVAPECGGQIGDRCGSGDLALYAAPLLLGQAAPNAVAFAVLERPSQALFADPATTAERERRTCLIFGDGEEQVGLDAEAGGSVLPVVRGGRVRGERLQIDVREPFDPQQTPPSIAGRARRAP